MKPQETREGQDQMRAMKAHLVSRRHIWAKTCQKDAIGKKATIRVAIHYWRPTGTKHLAMDGEMKSGQGMRQYYDETYPKYLEKFAKKYGSKVSEGSVPTERSRDASGIPSMYPQQEPVRYIEITPEMRKALGGKDKGVPLFQAAPLIPAGAAGSGGLLDQFGERQE